MYDKYYSVEQIAELLGIHPKTVQRYIREGRLRAVKVGKGWRVDGHDLSVFTEQGENTVWAAAKAQTPAEKQERVRASSVIDIGGCGREDAVRIINALTAALNSKPPEYGASTMYAQVIEPERTVRVSLWGSLRFLRAMTDFIASLTDLNEEG